MMVMFLGAASVAYVAEAHGSPAQHAAGLHTGVINGSNVDLAGLARQIDPGE